MTNYETLLLSSTDYRNEAILYFFILSYQGLRLSNLTLGLTALIFSDWIRHKPKIVTIDMINHKAVQKIDKHQGPISSTSLRRVFVLKTSYEVRTLKIGFHQTIELCELLTFCRIFKTNI